MGVRREAISSVRRRPRAALLAAATLAAAATLLPAGAAARTTMSVDASLSSCQRQASGAATCSINVSFSTVAGAQRYTAEVTRPDGSTVNLGEVPAGAAQIWIEHTGNGTYKVTISAFG